MLIIAHRMCSLCQNPTDDDHEYTTGIYICSPCADDIQDWHDRFLTNCDPGDETEEPGYGSGV